MSNITLITNLMIFDNEVITYINQYTPIFSYIGGIHHSKKISKQ